MATAPTNIGQDKITALYLRLSVEDIKDKVDDKEKDSNSIENQKKICQGYFLHKVTTHILTGRDSFVAASNAPVYTRRVLVGGKLPPSPWSSGSAPAADDQAAVGVC